VASLTPTDLNALTVKTRVLLNTVGPYYLYSTPVVEACVEQGTHYIDVSVSLAFCRLIVIKARQNWGDTVGVQDH